MIDVKRKVALASCSGMSPNGLVSRVACSDTVEKSEHFISICMGATSADNEGFKKLMKKYPVIAVNGCESECVDKILGKIGVNPTITINVKELLDKSKLCPKNVSRLDEEDEKCVEVVKIKIEEIAETLEG